MRQHSSPAESIRQTIRFRALLWGIVLACAVAVSGCGSSSGSSETGEEPTASETSTSSSAFPVSLTNAFGTTEIEAKPERIVTLGIGSDDALLAMGVVPVAMSFATYGADEQGLHPWTKEKLEELGVETPTILPNSEEPPYEQIINAEPDLIVATYSGITEKQYGLLSKIAPTVAYQDGPWTTSWQDVITTAGEAIGEPDAAAGVIDGIHAEVQAAADAHPELEGKTVAYAQDYAGTFYVYDESDPRVEFAQDFGMVIAPAVSELDSDPNSTTYTLSYERLDELESDILVSFAETQKEQDDFVSADYSQPMSQVQSGAVASIVGPEAIAAVSPPTALSLVWNLDDYVAALSDAAQNVG